MDFKFKMTGFEEVSVGLRHAAERVSDAARKQMHRSADKIVKEAKLNTPVDTHALEESIHKEISYEARGRLRITVVAGGISMGTDVDVYAAMVHEHYESIPGAPGKKTIAKREANPGRYIGSKFLERAAESQQKRLEESMIEVINTEWQL